MNKVVRRGLAGEVEGFAKRGVFGIVEEASSAGEVVARGFSMRRIVV